MLKPKKYFVHLSAYTCDKNGNWQYDDTPRSVAKFYVTDAKGIKRRIVCLPVYKVKKVCGVWQYPDGNI